MISAVSLICMAEGVGMDMSPLNNREVYWCRYLDWFITFPLMIYLLCTIANEAVSRSLPTSRCVYSLVTTAGNADGGTRSGDGPFMNFSNLPAGYSGNMINGAFQQDMLPRYRSWWGFWKTSKVTNKNPISQIIRTGAIQIEQVPILAETVKRKIATELALNSVTGLPVRGLVYEATAFAIMKTIKILGQTFEISMPGDADVILGGGTLCTNPLAQPLFPEGQVVGFEGAAGISVLCGALAMLTYETGHFTNWALLFVGVFCMWQVKPFICKYVFLT